MALKPTSFKIDDEILNKMRYVCGEAGISQAEFIRKAILNYYDKLKTERIKTSDFIVKVYRAWEDNFKWNYDGWFYSKVYAIKDNSFLVYDNGELSAADKEPLFTWVNFDEYFEDLDGEFKSIVELSESEVTE